MVSCSWQLGHTRPQAPQLFPRVASKRWVQSTNVFLLPTGGTLIVGHTKHCNVFHHKSIGVTIHPMLLPTIYQARRTVSHLPRSPDTSSR